MDPNAALQELDSLQAEYAQLSRGPYTAERQAAADRICELREALTVWLARGGFAPDWTTGPRAARYFGH